MADGAIVEMATAANDINLLRVIALRALFGARNGAIYGARVRAPHSVVNTLLFMDGSAIDKLRLIVKATATHAARLALYAFLYKTIFNGLAIIFENARGSDRPAEKAERVLESRLWTQGRSGIQEKNAAIRAAIAGTVAGGFVFRRDSSINQQIVFYLFSRTVVGAVKKFGAGLPPALKTAAWPMFAGLCWGGVMSMWESDKKKLQKGLVSSMDYIYRDSDLSSLLSWRGLIDWGEIKLGFTHRG